MLHICYSCFSVLPGLFHPGSKTEQEFIFKRETHKLTLHIKVFVFPSGNCALNMPDTITSLPNKPRDNYCKTSWNDFLEITQVFARHWFSSRRRKKGEWRAIPHAELPRANLSFSKDPSGARMALLCAAG